MLGTTANTAPMPVCYLYATMCDVTRRSVSVDVHATLVDILNVFITYLISSLSPHPALFTCVAVYEAKDVPLSPLVLSASEGKSDTDRIHRVSIVSKTFQSETDAKEYYWRFWGIHTNTIIPSRYYIDVHDKLR